MSEVEEPAESWTHNLGRRALAVLILLVCAYLLFHLLFGIVVFVATIAAVAVAVVGVIWAIRVLF
jgi:energy-coupling factor transporter transmembrane protein EcfT